MQNRAWRKSLDSAGTTVRELYAADGPGNENFTLPSVTFVYGLTIPENTFASGSVTAIPCVFKIKTQYCFSQRRLNIDALVSGLVESKIKKERNSIKAEISKKLGMDDMFDEIEEEDVTVN